MGRNRAQYSRRRKEGRGKPAAPKQQQAPKQAAAAKRLPGSTKEQNGGSSAPVKAGDARYLLGQQRYDLNRRGLARAANAPVSLCPRNWKVESLHMGIVFVLVAALYAYTTPRVVAFEDDGLFLMNMHYFGVAHPPGYPLHSILGGIFYHLFPYGSPAFKGHFFSGVVGALSCSGVYAATVLLTRGRLPAYVAGLGYGASMTFWSQAIIAEVYTLNTMMFFIVLPLCLIYASHVGRSDTAGHRRVMYAIAFFYGLGLSNHWVLLGIGSVGFGLLVFSQLRHILRPRAMLAALCFLLLGLLPYMWMVIRSWQDVPISFYGAIDSVEKFLFYVARSGYSGVDDQLGVNIGTKLEFAKHLFSLMAWQFTPIGAALAAVGAYAMMRSCHLWTFLSFLLTWFMSSVFLVVTINFKAEFIWLTAFRVYPLIAYGVMAIWIGYGVAWLATVLPGMAKRWLRTSVAAAAGSTVVCASVYAHWDDNNRHDYRWAHDFGMFKLNSLEKNTEYFTFDDLDVPVGYLHYVEGVRPDIKVYNDQGLVFGNRLYSPLSGEEEKIRRIQEFILGSGDRPVYYHPLRTTYFRDERHGSDLLGFFRRVHKEGPEDRVILDERLREWLDMVTDPDQKITDLWTRHQRYTIVATLTHTLLLASTAGYKFNESWQTSIDHALETNVLARVSSGLTRYRYGLMKGEDIRKEWEWSEEIRTVLDEQEHLDGKGRSHFYLLRALLASALQADKPEVFEENLRLSLAQSVEADNPALEALLDHYASTDRHDEFLGVMEQYYLKEKDIPERFKRLRTGFQRAQDRSRS